MPANSQKTSWQCSPTSPPNTTGEDRTLVRKIRLKPDSGQRTLFNFVFGASRFFYNKAKSVCDKASREGYDARVGELTARERLNVVVGICCVETCGESVEDPEADPYTKKRWMCNEHVASRTFGAQTRVPVPTKDYQKLREVFDHNCLTHGCQDDAIADTFRCEAHQKLGVEAEDPIPTTTYSPYNFFVLKELVNPTAENLQDDEAWYAAVPCNTKTAAVEQYTSAAQSTFTKWKRGDMKAELPDWRRKTDYTQSFAIRDSAISFRKAKAKTSPKLNRKNKKRYESGSKRKRLKTRFRRPRPRGSKGREWELRLFPGQDFSAMSGAATHKSLPKSKSIHDPSVAAKRPIRLKRCDMVRIKKAASGKWCESKVQRDRAGHHHLLLTMTAPERVAEPIWEQQGYRDAFLDPGGRTFLELYSPDGVSASIGDNFYGEILPTLRRADMLMGRADAYKRTRNGVNDGPYHRMLVRAHVLRTKVHNRVRDLHRKTARFLCSNFKAIFLPRFDMGRIADTSQLSRRISNSSVRNLMTFAHAEFRNTLQSYALARGVHIIETGEAFTTKTCTFCGTQNCVGSKKKFKCIACKRKVHRDPAAARNIGFRTAVFSD